MAESNTKILLVEDNPGDARLLEEALVEIAELRFQLAHSATLSDALDYLSKNHPDVGLVDLGLPDSQGLEVVRRVHSVAPNMPLLVLTALNDEGLAVQALQE